MTLYWRNLPQWHPPGKTIFITWRLYGSLPRKRVREAECLRSEPGKRFLVLDRHLDRATSGPFWLADPEIASYAEYPILRGAELQHYELHSYVIMPNHVHVLLDPWIPLAKITGAIKGVAARDANATLGRTGKHFWQDESFDHWIRNQAEFERIRHYIEWNPVKANLVARPEDWKWSSVHGEWRKFVERSAARSGCATRSIN
jgi:REP-associated tyrosine transposase